MNKKLVEQVLLCPVYRENKVVFIENMGAKCSGCGSMIPYIDGYLDTLQTQSNFISVDKKVKSLV